MPRLVRYEAEQDGDHEFCTYDLDAEPGGDLVEELANLARQLYVDTQRLREVLQQAAVGLEPVADASHIEAAIAETVSAVVPPPGARLLAADDTLS